MACTLAVVRMGGIHINCMTSVIGVKEDSYWGFEEGQSNARVHAIERSEKRTRRCTSSDCKEGHASVVSLLRVMVQHAAWQTWRQGAQSA
mmetsp:Transcript_33767/g.55541  ORF Transcript_33767/g.55541 Transcript_33767/m.55541 type:complete len:90 (-) Transcript_33767:14-283(-)